VKALPRPDPQYVNDLDETRHAPLPYPSSSVCYAPDMPFLHLAEVGVEGPSPRDVLVRRDTEGAPNTFEPLLRVQARRPKLARKVEIRHRQVTWSLTSVRLSGLTPGDSPLILRDMGNQEAYALDVDWP
jgi:hypothetical protein